MSWERNKKFKWVPFFCLRRKGGQKPGALRLESGTGTEARASSAALGTRLRAAKAGGGWRALRLPLRVRSRVGGQSLHTAFSLVPSAALHR